MKGRDQSCSALALSLSKGRSFLWEPNEKSGASTSSARTEVEASPNGFTLVEMLVALSIFAAIAAMGVSLLRSSIDTQDAVQGRLQAMGGFNRLRAVMANDLAQALPRATRGLSGEDVPAFIGTSTSFAFVHAGAGGTGAGPRPDIERVGYALMGGEWRRASQPMLDGTALGAGDRLIDEVASVAVRYRGIDGNWSDTWSSGVNDQLPRAVEVRLTRRGRAPLTMLFLTAPTPPPPPGSEGEAP